MAPYLSQYLKLITVIVAFSTIVSCSIISDHRSNAQFEALKRDAIAGNTEAQLKLADEYRSGKLVPIDEEAALQWYRSAADNGSAEAAYKVSIILLEKQPSEHVDALAYLEQAANASYALAQWKLADALVLKNPHDTNTLKTAYELYRSAAEQNIVDAQYKVAKLLANGQGTTRNRKQAFYWYKRAADQGDARAQLEVGNYFAVGIAVNVSLESSVEWYTRAANQGDYQSQSNLGDLFTLEKYNSVRDLSSGAKWYQLAAEQGHAHAQARLGELLEYGIGLPRDMTNAARWYRSASEQGIASAQCRLGSLYQRGAGITQNTNEAERWFELAAAQVPTNVRPLLGFIYYDCTQFDQDEFQFLEASKIPPK